MASILPTTTKFELVSPGFHPAVCCEFKDLGIVETRYGKKPKGMWVFQVDEEDQDGRRKEIRCKFNLTVGTVKKPSKVQELMGKWRKKPYTQEELENGDVDPERPVGVPCIIDVMHKTLDDGTEIHFVDGVHPPGDVKLTPKNYVPVDERAHTETHDDEPGVGPEVTGARNDRPPF